MKLFTLLDDNNNNNRTFCKETHNEDVIEGAEEKNQMKLKFNS